MVQDRAATKRDTAVNDFFHCECVLLVFGSEEEPWISQLVESPGIAKQFFNDGMLNFRRKNTQEAKYLHYN